MSLKQRRNENLTVDKRQIMSTISFIAYNMLTDIYDLQKETYSTYSLFK